uniref:RING-type domain-containing protein n=1 Tax=Kalanchoe fedtschenkoi TaxID=63787 RepID=A0A7N0UDU4_KALFE
MAYQSVNVEREKLAACMRCGICNRLLRDATTVSECMHHFCRKCIYKNITVEEVDTCPVCGVSLGADPLEKLRPDHSLRELRNKIFRSKILEARPTYVEPEPEPLSASYSRRKERSLSSLGANAPKQRSEPVASGKRLKPLTRRSSYLQSSSYLEKSNKKKDSNLEELRQNSSSSEEKQKSSEENSDDERRHTNKSKCKPDNKVKPAHSVDDIWNPLNYLVEVANKTKPENGETPNKNDDELPVRKSRMKDCSPKTDIDEDFQLTNPKKSRRAQSKKTPEIPVRIIPSTSFSENSSNKDKRNGPIWFQLLASESQGPDVLLPQIPASYLRIKNGSMTVSSVRKYLMKKLNIGNEDEIEITCMGQLLSPTMLLTDVVATWLQATAAPEKITVTVGSSAKDLLMVLTYSRRAQAAIPAPSPAPAPPTSHLSFLHL